MNSDVTGLGKSADAIAKIANSELASKVYDDAMSKPLSEMSEIAAEVLRGFRLLTAPFALMANCRERFDRYCDLVRARVPTERQTEAAPNISGPVFERLKYEAPDSYLVNLYLQLLTTAIDADRVDLAHPAFPGLISQLSRDQAIMLLYLKRHGRIDTEDECSFDPRTNHCGKRIRSTSYSIPDDQLQYSDRVYTHLWHLLGLNLVDRPDICTELRQMESRQRTSTLWELSDFGEAFVEACIPDEPIVGFEPVK